MPAFPDDAFELVFTMAVIEHIHPDESQVFDEMIRIGRQILAIEPPGGRSHRQFPWNVPQVFTSRGMKLVSSRPMAEFPSIAGDEAIQVFVASRFQRPSDLSTT